MGRQVGADRSNRIAGIHITFLAQRHRYHRLQALLRQLRMIDQILTQGTGTHTQHRVIKGPVKGLAQTVNAGKGPGLGNKSPGAVHRVVEHTAGNTQMRQSQIAAAPHPGLGKALERPKQVGAAVKGGFEHVGHIAQLLFCVDIALANKQSVLVALPGFKGQG